MNEWVCSTRWFLKMKADLQPFFNIFSLPPKPSHLTAIKYDPFVICAVKHFVFIFISCLLSRNGFKTIFTEWSVMKISNKTRECLSCYVGPRHQKISVITELMQISQMVTNKYWSLSSIVALRWDNKTVRRCLTNNRKEEKKLINVGRKV